jgi:hypothetical protein
MYAKKRRHRAAVRSPPQLVRDEFAHRAGRYSRPIGWQVIQRFRMTAYSCSWPPVENLAVAVSRPTRSGRRVRRGEQPAAAGVAVAFVAGEARDLELRSGLVELGRADEVRLRERHAGRRRRR